MLLGERCTRRCSFCSVSSGTPESVDEKEPERVAKAVSELGLDYVVITSVTRDDLEDKGARTFARAISLIKESRRYANPVRESHSLTICADSGIEPPSALIGNNRRLKSAAFSNGVKVEVLVPDFGGITRCVLSVAGAAPDVFGHNLETVERLYQTIRPQADYKRSLSVLEMASSGGLLTKSGLMVGFGERKGEVVSAMRDLADVGVKILTIGQYLKPHPQRFNVLEYVEPPIFEEYKAIAEDAGFAAVASGPFVRSSYRAKELYIRAQSVKRKTKS